MRVKFGAASNCGWGPSCSSNSGHQCNFQSISRTICQFFCHTRGLLSESLQAPRVPLQFAKQGRRFFGRGVPTRSWQAKASAYQTKLRKGSRLGLSLAFRLGTNAFSLHSAKTVTLPQREHAVACPLQLLPPAPQRRLLRCLVPNASVCRKMLVVSCPFLSNIAL